MRAAQIVEQIMSMHWDLAVCRCWVCVAGREIGLRPREELLSAARRALDEPMLHIRVLPELAHPVAWTRRVRKFPFPFVGGMLFIIPLEF